MTDKKKRLELYFDTEEHKKEAKEFIQSAVVNGNKKTIASILYLLLDTVTRQEVMLAELEDQLEEAWLSISILKENAVQN